MDFLGTLLAMTGLTKAQRAFLMRAGWVSFVSAHIAWVCGWLTPMGLEPPFAHASNFTTLVQTIKDERIERLDHDIQIVRAQQCRTEANSPPRQNYTDRLNELVIKYYHLTGAQARVPHCDET